MTADVLHAFAIAAPGLEPLVARELRALGLAGTAEQGGVAFDGTLEAIARANLWLRTASRVVVRVTTFRARTFAELERHARAVPWDRFVARDGTRPVAFRITARKSRLYHTGAIAQRLAESMAARLGTTPEALAARASRDAEDEEAGEPARRRAGEDEQLFVVRVARDEVTVSADASGALLHLRGYRQALAKAPLRETLAAALIASSGWTGEPGGGALVDPMCGSGTIPIEAALLARRLAPGRHRRFAFQQWPEWTPALWSRLLAEADERALPRAPVAIAGSDRDAGAIAAARANAERAGVSDDVALAVLPLSAIEPPAGETAGALVTNPPYGVRVGEADRLRDLYATFGRVARQRFPGWTLALLSPDERLHAQLGLPLEERLRTRNGGIAVRVLVAAPAPDSCV